MPNGVSERGAQTTGTAYPVLEGPSLSSARLGTASPGPRLLVVLVLTAMVSLQAGCRGDGRFEVVMEDSSMEPTYTAFAAIRFRTATSASRGQVVAYEYPFTYPGRPRRELVARVIGLPGDLIELSATGVTINGQRLIEPYAKNQQVVWPAEFTVAPETYFLLGDDRNNQRDSRWWGSLPATKLLGVAD